jgi:hypothetical protein
MAAQTALSGNSKEYHAGTFRFSIGHVRGEAMHEAAALREDWSDSTKGVPRIRQLAKKKQRANLPTRDVAKRRQPAKK